MPTSMFPASDPFWSSDPVIEEKSLAMQAVQMSLALAAIGSAGALARNTEVGSFNALDHAQDFLRRYGYGSPFSLLNTFRTAEFLSPFVSVGSHYLDKGLSFEDGKTKVSEYKFKSNFLKEEITQDIFEHLFPKLKELRQKEQSWNYKLQEENFEIVFQAKDKASSGTAYLRNLDTGEAKAFAENVSLMEARAYEVLENPKIAGKNKINPAFFSVLQSSGLIDEMENYRALTNGPSVESRVEKFGTVFDETTKSKQSLRFGLIPSPTASLENASLYMRAFSAFGMARTNRLLETTIEQVPVLERVVGKMANVGISPAVQYGSASKMFARYGGKALGLGTAYMAVEQIDHYRRQFGILGDFGASSLVGLGTAALTHRMFKDFGPVKSSAIGVGAFAAQMILPGFSEGVFPGLATTAKNIDIGTTFLGEITLMNAYRRTVEGFFPGISSPLVGAAVGIGVALAAGAGSDPISSKMFRSLTRDQKKFLFDGDMDIMNTTEAMPTRKKLAQAQLFKMMSGEYITPEAEALFKNEFTSLKFEYDPMDKAPSLKERRTVVPKLRSKAHSIGGYDAVHILEREMFAQYNKALEIDKDFRTNNNIFNDAYYRRLDTITSDQSLSSLEKVLARVKTKVVNAFFGASFEGEKAIESAKRSNVKNYLGRYPAVFLAGFVTHGLLSGGILGSTKSASEKAAEYDGTKLVAVKRGRWWEGGGTPFGGKDTMYYRPHMYHMYMNRVAEKAVYGENEDEISPMKKFYLENFTYEVEKMNYYNRPYPITSGAFENIPVVGKILASTIGRIIKPPKIMHASDFMRVGPDGNVEYKIQPEIDRPAYGLGGMAHGAPVSPFNISRVLMDTQYQFRELEGLTGWAKNMFQSATTGTQGFTSSSPIMESAGRMTSPNLAFWEMELGGGLFLSEAIRRFLPKQPSDQMNYNPIPNQMPSWLPERFHHGDPYRNAKAGIARMPGPGYAALHPELKGVDPEAYPDIYKYKILSDVAPTSKEFRNIRQRMYQRRAQGITSKTEELMMDQADQLLNEKMTYQQFDIDKNAYEIPLVSKASQYLYGGGVNILKDAVAPAEFMIPMGFRPTQKLLAYDNPIDQYEYQRLYGTTFAFWDKPIRDWFRPALYTAAHAMGYDGVPGYRERANETNEYFDKLEFYKQMQLAYRAEINGDGRGKKLHLMNAQRTRYGVNPQGSAMAIYQTLPDGEKEFFDAFMAAKGSERERILEMVPGDQVELYQNLYNRIDNGDTSVYPGSKTNVDERYLNQRLKELDSYFDDKNLPEADWVGWHEDVDLDDVKVRYVDHMGMDLYDVDMYNSKLKAQKRRTYLEGSEQALIGSNYMLPGRFSVISGIRNFATDNGSYGYADADINAFSFGSQNRAYFNIQDDRRYEILRMLGDE